MTYNRGKPHVKTLGRFPAMSVAKAIRAAHAFDPDKAKAAAAAGSFKEVAEQWLALYVDAKGLRSKGEIVRQLESYIYPKWATTPLFAIRRRTVNDLLDGIAKDKSATTAQAVFATIRSIMNWAATRDEDYNSPLVKGMRWDFRSAPQRARSRVLNDDEIRAVWKAAENAGQFGAIVKLLLLTGQRREKVATMRWEDVKDGIWTITTAKREKGNAGALRLPTVALEIIEAQDEVVGNPFIFPGNERKRQHPKADRSRPPCFNGWSKSKRKFDARLPPDMPPWVVHDLRRTARSLMSRAGVPRDHAERVLGHVIAGVEGVYDRHAYAAEKADALDRLAQLIDRIVNPPSGNVVPMIAGMASV